MNSAATVDNEIKNWKNMGLSKSEICVKAAEACMGWPYVFGGAGQYDTPNNRESYAGRSSCPSAEAAVIRSLCQVLSGKKSGCAGCKWYPSAKVRFFDCRGFTRWILQQVDILIQGGGATSQWNTESNWTAKGEIGSIPNAVCCVFMKNSKTGKMEHTGLHVGDGIIIHCSGEVKRGKTTDKGWTHWAAPVGMDGDIPVPTPVKPTLRKGSSGSYVVELQQDLIALHYDLSPYGADGKFGAKTETAVKAFQKDSGLTADGIVGPKTWDALDAAVTPGGTLYTVTIPHLDAARAQTLCTEYPEATIKEE